MSAREYFALRNAIPGYTFILIIIAINYVPLLYTIKADGFSEVFGAFLAFLTLFSGSSIGFLISQVWWWNWQRHYGILEEDDYKEAVNAFCRKYFLTRPKSKKGKKPETEIETDKRMFIAAIDYVEHVKIDESDSNLLKMAERRWDMFHTLSSTKIALITGLVSAVLARGLCLVFSITFQIPAGEFSALEFLGLISICSGAVIFLYLLRKGKQWFRSSSASFQEAMIRRSKVTPTELAQAFPRIYRKYSIFSKEENSP